MGLILFILLLIADGSAFADDGEPSLDLLQRSSFAPYQNYAEVPFRPYRERLRVNPRYNYFGEFLAEGYHAFRLDEQRPGASVIGKDDVYRGLFNTLLVARSSYGDFSAALTVGDDILHTLSALTMQRAGFNGVRWEVVYPRHRLTLLASRGFDNKYLPGFKSFSSPVVVDPLRPGYDLLSSTMLVEEEENPVYTLGGHWEGEFGPALTLGATLVNQQQLNSVADRKGGLLRGSVPYPEMLPPQKLMLRVTEDGAREDGPGAAVFAVALEIEATDGSVHSLLSSDPESPHYHAGLEPVISGGRRVEGHWEVRGDEELVYTFELPAEVTPRRARFRVEAANDFRIAVAQQHPLPLQTAITTPYTILHRAPGRRGDLSNRKELVLDYGLATGQTLYGLNFAADLVGLKLQGEIATNSLYRKFPVLGGHNLDRRASAWYLNAVKTVSRFRHLILGAELFYMGPRYGGDYDSRRGGVVLYTDVGGSHGRGRGAAEYVLMDDNDDRDRYADDNSKDFPGSSDPLAGVYPGLDEDNDNIPDDDRNANGIPDFQEPFLLFYSDPQEFVYGPDLNNNGVIDPRENDAKPDYPYDRDRRGRHFLVSLRPLPGLELGAGNYRLRTIVAGGRALSTYLRASYRFADPRRFELRLNHDSKRVRDDIPDPVYVFDQERNLTLIDPLLQRNSWVHTSFAGLRFTLFSPMNLESNAKLVHNRMQDLESTEEVEKDRRGDFTWVNRADYRWQWGKLRIRPMYKNLWQRVTLESQDHPLISTVQSAPILRLDYAFNDELVLQVGQQGFRLRPLGIDRRLAFRFIDKVDETQNYSSTDFLIMFTIRGDYLGNKVTANTGIHRRRMEFDEDETGEKRKLTRLFVEVVTGFERY